MRLEDDDHTKHQSCALDSNHTLLQTFRECDPYTMRLCPKLEAGRYGKHRRVDHWGNELLTFVNLHIYALDMKVETLSHV